MYRPPPPLRVRTEGPVHILMRAVLLPWPIRKDKLSGTRYNGEDWAHPCNIAPRPLQAVVKPL